MRGLNKIMVMGRLAADPEMRYTARGRAVCRFRVAVNRRWRDTEGQLQERVEWFRVVVWGRQAEICNQYLERGSPVYIEGRIETRSFEGADGNVRTLTELVARDVVILPRGNGKVATTDATMLEEA
jgi:single-strand DNA-binding protein